MLRSGPARELRLVGAAIVIAAGGGCTARFHNDPFAARPTAHEPVAEPEAVTLAARISLPQTDALLPDPGLSPADRRTPPRPPAAAPTTIAGVPTPSVP